MLFEILKYAPLTLFALEATNTHIKRLIFGDPDYFRNFSAKAFSLDTTTLSMKDVKFEIAR
jgi:hypothetical protein